jgi:hypothetical protein
MVITEMIGRANYPSLRPAAAMILSMVMLFQSPTFAQGDPPATTHPLLGGILAYDPDLLHNAQPLELTNDTTVTVHLLGAEGIYDAIHLSETPDFSDDFQSYWLDADIPTSVSFTLSPGDSPKTIWALLDNGEEISFPLTSHTLMLDTRRPDLMQSQLAQGASQRLRVNVHFDEDVHDFAEDDVWLAGTAVQVENFAGEAKDYQFDVAVGGVGWLMIGIKSEEIFDLAGNAVVEQATPLMEYNPFIPLGSEGVTESSTLMGGLFTPFLGTPSMMALSLPGGGSGGGGGMMMMGEPSSGEEEVWVDFFWDGPFLGTEEDPYQTLADGLAAVADSGTVKMRSGSSGETMVIDQPVRLESVGGTARIGDLTQFETQYLQLEIGIPLNVPENAVVAQVIKGSQADPVDLVIGDVQLLLSGEPAGGSTDWFDLVAMGDGNFSLVWAPGGFLPLVQYDGIRVRLDKVVGGVPTPHKTLDFDLTTPQSTTTWAVIDFGSYVDVWAMTIPPHLLIAPEGTASAYWYAFEVGKSYPVQVRKKTRLHDPPPIPYLGWTAFTFNLTDAIDGWQAAPAGYWAHDPQNVIGGDRDTGNVVGGKAKLYFDGLSLFSPTSVQSLYLVEKSQTIDKEILQEKIIIKLPGLGAAVAAGLPNSAGEVVLKQIEDFDPQVGRIRVYNASNPSLLTLLIDGTQDSASVPLSAVGAEGELPVIVESTRRGFGSFDVFVRHKAQDPEDFIHDAAINYFNFAVTVTLEEIDSAIETNPNAGGGKRIFPDKQTPTDTTARNTLKARVVVDPALLTVPMHVRVLDVDDASPNILDPLGEIDTNGPLGDDNFGSAAVLAETVGETDFGGIYEVEFEVGMQPGDNYRVAVALRQWTVNGLTVTDNLSPKFVLADNNQKAGFNGQLSEMLTVWRRLWYEFDSMGAIPTSGAEKNFDDGVIDAVQTNVPETGKSTLDVGRLLTDEANRFENGQIIIASVGTLDVVSNTDNVALDDDVVIVGTPGSQVVGKSFELYDDDSATMPYSLSVGSLILSAFEDAYILPVPAGATYTDNDTPFNRNIEDQNELIAVTSVNKDLVSTEDFWLAYLLAAFQGGYLFDNDPVSEEDALYGESADDAGDDSLNQGAVYIELYDELSVPPAGFLDHLIVHEIGHQGSEDHVPNTVMDEKDFYLYDEFGPTTIRRYRMEPEY